MRFLRVIIPALFAVIQVSAQSDTKRPPGSPTNMAEIEGNIRSTQGKPLLLKISYRKLHGGFTFDSCRVDDTGHFQFSKPLDEPVMMGLVLEVTPEPGQQKDLTRRQQNPDNVYSCFLIPGKSIFTVNGKLKDATVEGSIVLPNADYKLLSNDEYAHNVKSNAMVRAAGTINDTSKVVKARQMAIFDSMEIDKAELIYKPFFLSHPQSPVAVYALLQYAYNPPFESRKDMQPALIEKYLDGISQLNQRMPSALDLRASLQLAKLTAIGNKEIDFTAPDSTGKTIKLSAYRGKYVLVDFWASWCVPCRAENPNVLSAYRKYYDKGFTVLGVSLDSPGARSAWLKAVKQDGMPWTQVSELSGFNSQTAKAYGVKSIPMNFLIDPDGKIIAKSLHAEYLQKKLAQIFKD